MKTRYTKSQIVDAIKFWRAQLLRESLEPKTEAKLKEAAKVFAKTIGAQIKAGGMFRIEDGETPDPLVAIKTTIKKGVSVDNCKRELKKLGMPAEVIDQMAKNYSDWFSKSIFGGDRKAIANLLKTTEQFNYFANAVVGIWHRDPELSKLLKKNPPNIEESEDSSLDELTEGEAKNRQTVTISLELVDVNGEEEAQRFVDGALDGDESLTSQIEVLGEDPDGSFGTRWEFRGPRWLCRKLWACTMMDDGSKWWSTSDLSIPEVFDQNPSRYSNSGEFADVVVDESESFRANGNEDIALDEDDCADDAENEDDLDEDDLDGVDLDEDDLDERYDRYGGYGGYGRKYSSYGSSAPRGAAIGWYCVADVDPACKSMSRNWRFGPIEFTRGIVDFLYPERQYKRGATMLRNKHVQMPDTGEDVEVYVGIASIFDAVKNNDTEALTKLEQIGINKNVSLGLDPDDDYTSQYVLK